MEDLEEKINIFFKTPAGVTFAGMTGVKEFVRIIKDWVKDYVSDYLKENKKVKTFSTVCYPIIFTRDNPEFSEMKSMVEEGRENFENFLSQGYQIQQANLSTMRDVVYIHYVLVKEI